MASEVARLDPAPNPLAVAVEHPAGQFEVSVDVRRAADGIEVVSAGLTRTARLIFDGTIYVPGGAPGPRQVGDEASASTSSGGFDARQNSLHSRRES